MHSSSPITLPPGAFFGNLGAHKAAHCVRASVTSYAPRVVLPNHAHERPYLSFVLAGGYTERTGFQVLACGLHALRFHPAGEEHANSFSAAGGGCLNLELDDTWEDSLVLLSRSRLPLLLDSVAWIGLRAAAECRRDDVDSELVLASLVAEMMAACERCVQRDIQVAHRPGVRAAIAHIGDSPHARFSLPILAAVAGLHPTHFARSFRKATGLTVGEFVRVRRVVFAQRLLSERRSATIAEVAAEAGFADHAHLTRTFRLVVGSTPSQFRAALGSSGIRTRSTEIDPP